MTAALLAIGAVVAGLALFEITMQPTATERMQLGAIFIAVATLGAIGTAVLARAAGRWRSIRRAVVAVVVVAFGIALAGIAIAAQQMFFSDHDLTLLMVVLGFALVAAIGFAITISRPLTRDLERVAAAAEELEAGDLGARTGVERSDEIGSVASAFDAMAAVLEAAEQDRRRNDEARRSFLAAVGHDLRTPLASLLAAVEALRDGVAPDPDRYLASMERDVEALSALVDDVFLLAKLDEGSARIAVEPVDVTELADEAIEVLRPVAARAGVELRLDADHRTIATGGSEALSRVLRNLLDNAIRHAPEGTAVIVEVRNGDGALVKVRDDGPGFDPEFVEAAFDRFSRGDPARRRDTGGSGLGLAIARGFVDALHGEIWAEPGPGGVVAFRLPGDHPSTRTPRQNAM